MTNIDYTQDKLKELIKNRIHTYYPDLTIKEAHIHNNHPVKRQHTSLIYQFDIYDKSNFLKSLIVKKRIYNPDYNNDIVRDTEIEFNNLKVLNNLGEGKLSVCCVLDTIPEEGILITEKVKGKSLYSYLKTFSYLPLTKSKKVFLEKLFTKVGEWLREFHNAGFTGQKDKIYTQDFIKKAEFIIDKFPSCGLSEDLGQNLLNKMKTLEKEVLNYTFPVTFKHGDFQSTNIIYNNDMITVLDITSPKRDINIKDVCNFITGVNTFNIKLLYSFLDKKFMKKFIECFLSSYFKEEPFPYSAIEFIKPLGILESFENAYKRNSTLIRKNAVIAFYKRKMKELINAR